ELLGTGEIDMQLDIVEAPRNVFEDVLAGLDRRVFPDMLLSIEAVDLVDRQSADSESFGERVKRHVAGERHLLVEGHVGIAAAVHPGNLDAPPRLVGYLAPGLRRIKIGAEVTGDLAGLRCELGAVKVSDRVFA